MEAKNMSKKSIGEVISGLRKEKGVTQEELGKAVGVSTQAVSKWENGGVPDVELLEPIADFFGVSLDALFDRGLNDYASLEEATAKYFSSLSDQERAEKAFEYCWAVERALCGSSELEESTALGVLRKKDVCHHMFSQVLKDSFISLMSLSADAPYFAFFPETPERTEWLFEKTDYPEFFSELADRDIFNAFLLVHKRDKKGFTENLFVKELGITPEKAKAIVAFLTKYGLINTTELELDDEVKKVYTPKPNPAIIPFLTFACELVSRPGTFYYWHEGRREPYIRLDKLR
jgi:transcriptional regulator with XRE-family HTH domain